MPVLGNVVFVVWRHKQACLRWCEARVTNEELVERRGSRCAAALSVCASLSSLCCGNAENGTRTKMHKKQKQKKTVTSSVRASHLEYRLYPSAIPKFRKVLVPPREIQTAVHLRLLLLTCNTTLQEVTTAAASPTNKQVKLLTGWRRGAYEFVLGPCVWVRKEGGPDYFVEQYGMFFEQYRGGYQWFSMWS